MGIGPEVSTDMPAASLFLPHLIDLECFISSFDLLYWDLLGWWGLRDKEFPDLKEITDFTIAIQKQPPPSAQRSGGVLRSS
jgi:hypothetical protein